MYFIVSRRPPAEGSPIQLYSGRQISPVLQIGHPDVYTRYNQDQGPHLGHYHATQYYNTLASQSTLPRES